MISTSPTLEIEAGSEAWTLQAAVSGSRTKVVGDPATVSAILHGDRSGLEAFLQGKIRVTGNLAVALQLETVFGNGRQAVDHWKTGHLAVVDPFDSTTSRQAES